MAKKHKNIDKIPIKWNGEFEDPPFPHGNKNQSIPENGDFHWGGHTSGEYIPNTECPKRQQSRTEPECFWEDYDYPATDGEFNVADLNWWAANGGKSALVDVIGNPSIDDGETATSNGYLTNLILDPTNYNFPKKAADGYGSNTYTWGDVNFVIEIADGIGTGSRRARQDRLNKILDDEDKKKRIIHLICRVKGEKVFDEDIEVKDVQVNIKDVDMITERILGKVTMETEDVL